MRLFAGLLAATFCAAPAWAIVLDINRDPAAALLPDSATGPFAGVGTVSAGGGSCTGSAVGARLVVTAAHCIGDGPAHFRLPYSDAPPVERTGQATRYPGYLPDVSPFDQPRTPDVAVVTFDEPLPDPVPRAHVLAGEGSLLDTPVEVVGYGESGDGETGSLIGTDGKRFALNVVDMESGRRDRFSATFNETATGGLGALEGTTGFGDSGGPAFLVPALLDAIAAAGDGPVDYLPLPGERLLLGVASYMSVPRDGQAFGTYGGSATWTSLALVADWIASFGPDVSLIPLAGACGVDPCLPTADAPQGTTSAAAAAPVPLAPALGFLVAGLVALVGLRRRAQMPR